MGGILKIWDAGDLMECKCKPQPVFKTWDISKIFLHKCVMQKYCLQENLLIDTQCGFVRSANWYAYRMLVSICVIASFLKWTNQFGSQHQMLVILIILQHCSSGKTLGPLSRWTQTERCQLKTWGWSVSTVSWWDFCDAICIRSYITDVLSSKLASQIWVFFYFLY